MVPLEAFIILFFFNVSFRKKRWMLLPPPDAGKQKVRLYQVLEEPAGPKAWCWRRDVPTASKDTQPHSTFFPLSFSRRFRKDEQKEETELQKQTVTDNLLGSPFISGGCLSSSPVFGS